MNQPIDLEHLNEGLWNWIENSYDTLAVFRTSEVIFVLRSFEPAALTLRFALLAAGRLGAVALMTQIAMIGLIELSAAEALALGRTLH